MRFPGALVSGRLVRRYKRFFADFDIGEEAHVRTVTAHCANPGSMRGCAELGSRGWLSPSANPQRKLEWTWELAEHQGALVCVNTARANQLVAEALGASLIAELRGHGAIRREVAVGDSRLDFHLSGGEAPESWIEVKSATMSTGDGVIAFPDAVTARGARHAHELAELARRGRRAILLFCAARSDATRVRTADEIDPAYGVALRHAIAAGVEVLAYGCAIDLEGISLTRRIPFQLHP